MSDEKDLARVDGQPLTAHGDLPRRPTGEVPPTAPEQAMHTPGPWAYVPNGRGWNNLCGVDGRLIWTASGRTGQDAANRALISTAPELLQLARRVADFFEGTNAPIGEMARRLVAKAEGR